jgi:hypothetical protein
MYNYAKIDIEVALPLSLQPGIERMSIPPIYIQKYTGAYFLTAQLFRISHHIDSVDETLQMFHFILCQKQDTTSRVALAPHLDERDACIRQAKV